MPIIGDITLPGDKSISHRALMCGALAEGISKIENLSTGQDVESTRLCLLDCGIQSTKTNNSVILTGNTFINPENPLDCGNSGTTVRLLSGLLAGKNISATFIGDESLSSRPMGRVLEPLQKMGVNVKSTKEKLPLTLRTSLNDIIGIQYCPPKASAQVKSCVLFAGLGANSPSVVTEKVQTRNHTEVMLAELGAEIIYNDKITIKPLQNSLSPLHITVPGDPSTAAFFSAAAAMIPGSNLIIRNVLANPTRIGFYDVLSKMGGDVQWSNLHSECGETVGDVRVKYSFLHGVSLSKKDIPNLIDELPILAVLATQADSPTTVTGAEELRVKESDRIHAICSNLNAMGAKVIEKKDGFIIDTPNILHNTSICTYHDHRIAMSFTIAGLNAGRYNTLDNEGCINISFPEFNSVLKKLVK